MDMMDYPLSIIGHINLFYILHNQKLLNNFEGPIAKNHKQGSFAMVLY
jgi:hypothetical protein